MYPGEGELDLADPAVESDLKEWLNAAKCSGAPVVHPPTLAYVLRITLPELTSPVTMRVAAGSKYPDDVNDLTLHLSCDQWERQIQAEANAQAEEQLRALAIPGEPAVSHIVTWLQENASNFIRKDKVMPSTSSSRRPAREKTSYVRLWIYSHHIYSKTKRRNILQLAADHALTGFTLPGKPGVLCLEGRARDANDAWATIRGWTWQRISLKSQDEDVDGQGEAFRCFTTFEEVAFAKGGSECKDYRADMGEFFAFLKGHECAHAFKELFGFDKDL